MWILRFIAFHSKKILEDFNSRLFPDKILTKLSQQGEGLTLNPSPLDPIGPS
jgi:hypothetical protein